MYDCVYPTRTARFGVALVDTGILKLKAHECSNDERVIDSDCLCQACRNRVTRKRLHGLFTAANPVALSLITQHNLAYMMKLVRNMHEAILNDKFADFCVRFVNQHFPERQDVPQWVVDALGAAGIQVP